MPELIKNKKKPVDKNKVEGSSYLTFKDERMLIEIAKKKVEVIAKGESDYKVGQIVIKQEVDKVNKNLAKKKKELVKFKEIKEERRANAIKILIDAHEKLIRYITKGHYSASLGVDKEDLISEATPAIIDAIEYFDTSLNNRLSTFAGYWIGRRIQTFLSKSQTISQGSNTKDRKTVVYYDEPYKSSDKEGDAYSLFDRLADNDNAQLTSGQVYQEDLENQVSNLINFLSKEESLVIRLYYKILPKKLNDILNLLDSDEERELLKKELNIKKDFPPSLSLSKKKCQKVTSQNGNRSHLIENSFNKMISKIRCKNNTNN